MGRGRADGEGAGAQLLARRPGDVFHFTADTLPASLRRDADGFAEVSEPGMEWVLGNAQGPRIVRHEDHYTAHGVTGDRYDSPHEAAAALLNDPAWDSDLGFYKQRPIAYDADGFGPVRKIRNVRARMKTDMWSKPLPPTPEAILHFLDTASSQDVGRSWYGLSGRLQLSSKTKAALVGLGYNGLPKERKLEYAARIASVLTPETDERFDEKIRSRVAVWAADYVYDKLGDYRDETTDAARELLLSRAADTPWTLSEQEQAAEVSNRLDLAYQRVTNDNRRNETGWLALRTLRDAVNAVTYLGPTTSTENSPRHWGDEAVLDAAYTLFQVSRDLRTRDGEIERFIEFVKGVHEQVLADDAAAA